MVEIQRIVIDGPVVVVDVGLGTDGHQFAFNAEQDAEMRSALNALDVAITNAVRRQIDRWAKIAAP